MKGRALELKIRNFWDELEMNKGALERYFCYGNLTAYFSVTKITGHVFLAGDTVT